MDNATGGGNMARTIEPAELKRQRQHKAKDAHEISGPDQEAKSSGERDESEAGVDVDPGSSGPVREKHGTIDTTATD